MITNLHLLMSIIHDAMDTVKNKHEQMYIAIMTFHVMNEITISLLEKSYKIRMLFSFFK